MYVNLCVLFIKYVKSDIVLLIFIKCKTQIPGPIPQAQVFIFRGEIPFV